MKFQYFRVLKPIAIIVLILFSWTFGGMFDIAYAIKSDQRPANSGQQKITPPGLPLPQGKGKKPEEKFNKAIDEIVNILSDHPSAISNQKDKLKAKKSEIEHLNVEIRKQFKATEDKIKDLPEEIKKRHRDFVKHYEDNLNELKANLDAIDKAKTKDQIEKEKARKHLEKVKPPKKYRPLDPNKLPHRTPELVAPNIKEIAPETEISPLSSIINFLDDLLVPSAYAQEPPSDPNLSETMEVQFTPEILDLAERLGNNPLRIYQYVRNNFEYEPYYGSLKGAQQTLHEKAGNDFDQASLLIALLRASNIPARYAYGTIEIPIEDVKNWLGIVDTNMALTALSSSYIPLMAFTSGSEVVSVQLEHVWCQAFVPYVQSRGASTGEGDMWIDLDPSFKSVITEIMEDIDLPDFDKTEYLSNIKQDDPITFYDINLQAYLDAIFTDRTTDAVKIQKEIETLWFEFLLGTLPYDVIESTIYSEIPDNYRYKIIFSTTDDETNIFGTPLTFTISTPELAGKRISLSYSPATTPDENLINQYGNIYDVPAYLLQVKPQLLIDGDIKASGSAIGFGKDQIFKINFQTPYGKSDRIENIVTSGGYYVSVMNFQKIPEHHVLVRTNDFRELFEILQTGGNVSLDDYAGEILNLVGLAYFQKLFAASENAEQILKVVDLKWISEAMVSIDVAVDYLFDTPVQVSLSGLSLDVDRNIHLAIPVDGNMGKKNKFMELHTITSSYFEHKIFEEIYDVESVSAVKIVQIANERGIPVYTIDSSNISIYINSLQISPDIKNDVVNAVNTGKEVVIPEQEMQILDWYGIGYIVIDPQTEAAAYMISGGLAGSSLAVMSLNLVNNIMSFGVDKAYADTVDNTLTPNYVRFPGPDDLWYTTKDKMYPLIDLIKFPEIERESYYYDPNPDRGYSGLIKIDEINQDDYITSFLQLKDFKSQQEPGEEERPYLRLHPSLIAALMLIKWYTSATHVIITSGYRNRLHNYAVGGKPKSWHMDGIAADFFIIINGVEPDKAYDKLKKAAFLVIGQYGGIGCYPNNGFIHIDTRGTRGRWSVPPGRCK